MARGEVDAGDRRAAGQLRPERRASSRTRANEPAGSGRISRTSAPGRPPSTRSAPRAGIDRRRSAASAVPRLPGTAPTSDDPQVGRVSGSRSGGTGRPAPSAITSSAGRPSRARMSPPTALVTRWIGPNGEPAVARPPTTGRSALKPRQQTQRRPSRLRRSAPAERPAAVKPPTRSGRPCRPGPPGGRPARRRQLGVGQQHADRGGTGGYAGF